MKHLTWKENTKTVLTMLSFLLRWLKNVISWNPGVNESKSELGILYCSVFYFFTSREKCPYYDSEKFWKWFEKTFEMLAEKKVSFLSSYFLIFWFVYFQARQKSKCFSLATLENFHFIDNYYYWLFLSIKMVGNLRIGIPLVLTAIFLANVFWIFVFKSFVWNFYHNLPTSQKISKSKKKYAVL